MAVEQPRQLRVLTWLWRRPAVSLVPLGLAFSSIVAGASAYDTVEFRRIGAAMWGPAILHTFDDPWVQIGPLHLLPIGAVANTASAVGLPVLLTIAFLQALVECWFALWTARRVVRAAGVDPLPVQWALGALVALGGYCSESISSGHVEELLIGLLLANVAVAVYEGRWKTVGLLLGIAVGIKEWALLAAGVLLWRRDVRGFVVSGATMAAVVAACYLPFVLGGPPDTFAFEWPMDPNAPIAVLAQATGMSGWGLRVVQAGVAGLAGVAVAWRGRTSPLVPVAVAIAVRLILDPVRLPYYDSPLVALVILWLWTASAPAVRRYRVFLTVLAGLVMPAVHTAYGPGGWVAGSVALGALAVGMALADESARSVPAPVQEKTRAPELASVVESV